MQERERQYYKEHKEQIQQQKQQKIKCVCGSEIQKGEIARHNKSIKHIKFVKQQEQNTH